MRRDLRDIHERHGERLTCSVAAAIIGAAVVGGGAAIYSSNKAAKQAQAGATQANQLIDKENQQIREDLGPYRDAGGTAIPTLLKLANGNPDEVSAALEKLPGYQFTRTQGLKAVQNSASARGLGVSGAAMKGAAGFATGLADSTFGDQYNRILGLAQLGESASAQTGSLGAGLVGRQSENITGAANAGAAASVAGGNAIGAAANSVGQYYALNSILSRASPGAAGGGGLYGGARATGG